jgi:hypothetical protein
MAYLSQAGIGAAYSFLRGLSLDILHKFGISKGGTRNGEIVP